MTPWAQICLRVRGLVSPASAATLPGFFLPILDLNAATYLIRLQLFVLSVCNASLKWNSHTDSPLLYGCLSFEKSPSVNDGLKDVQVIKSLRDFI